MIVFRIALIAMAMVLAGTSASAQVFGTFPWQMQPYCNTVTLSLINSATGFTVEGVDDHCGAANKGSAVGTASFNANGNITFSFTIVAAPAGRAVHVSAIVSPANGSGTWTDSMGGSGLFAFYGATGGLSPRPTPPSLMDVRFKASALNSQALPVGTTTATGWNEITNVGGGVYDVGTGGFTVPTDGVYMISTTVGLTGGGATGVRCLTLVISSTSGNSSEGGDCNPAVTGVEGIHYATVAALGAQNVVSVRIQNSSGVQANTTDTVVSVFSVTRLR